MSLQRGKGVRSAHSMPMQGNASSCKAVTTPRGAGVQRPHCSTPVAAGARRSRCRRAPPPAACASTSLHRPPKTQTYSARAPLPHVPAAAGARHSRCRRAPPPPACATRTGSCLGGPQSAQPPAPGGGRSGASAAPPQTAADLTTRLPRCGLGGAHIWFWQPVAVSSQGWAVGAGLQAG